MEKDFQELEFKILDVNVEELCEKLEDEGAILTKNTLQKIQIYEPYQFNLQYRMVLAEYQMTKSKKTLQKLANICKQFEPVILSEEQDKIKSKIGYSNISSYIENKDYKDIDYNFLKSKDVLNIIGDVDNRLHKWIRLRQNGDDIEFTVKYIYSAEQEYDIDKVKEVQILVDNYDVANMLIEELGYYRSRKLEKKRISYELDGVSFDIDEAPLLNPYVEIEGTDVGKLYEMVERLGYNREDTTTMNVQEIYKNQGYDLEEYEVLTFDEQTRFDGKIEEQIRNNNRDDDLER